MHFTEVTVAFLGNQKMIENDFSQAGISTPRLTLKTGPWPEYHTI